MEAFKALFTREPSPLNGHRYCEELEDSHYIRKVGAIIEESLFHSYPTRDVREYENGLFKIRFGLPGTFFKRTLEMSIITRNECPIEVLSILVHTLGEEHPVNLSVFAEGVDISPKSKFSKFIKSIIKERQSYLYNYCVTLSKFLGVERQDVL